MMTQKMNNHNFSRVTIAAARLQCQAPMPNTLAKVAARLVARFRRQRPLRGGSLIVTIFGDCIMPRGGAISLRSLIRIAAPFGLNERLVRTATARLAQEGWLDSRRVGNLSEYRLSAGGRERFAEATVRIYGGPATAWSGRWRLVVLPPMPAAERQTLRRDLTWRGFGEIANGVFAHPEYPTNAPGASPLGELAVNALVFDAELPDAAAAVRLVALGWDLQVLGKRYQAFVERFKAARAACGARAPVDPQAAFIVRTLLIHEYRRLHLRDPLLPARLLRADWPGTRAAELCGAVYACVFGPSEAYLSGVASQLDGKLPAPDASVMSRFGGIGGDHAAAKALDLTLSETR
jgi:phenylacetic acid degradation operon negative regulatory protein